MKTRLLCLTLGIMMLLTCLLTGCGGSSDNKDGTGSTTATVDNTAKTITMWVLTSKETTPRAQELVNEEFTKITKSKFKTNVELIFCTEEGYWEYDKETGEYKWNDTGYYERLEAAIEANEDQVKKQEAADYAYRVFRNANKNKGWDEIRMTQEFLADEQYKEFWPYITVPSEDDDEETEETEEETILNEYEIAEIKYPDAKENQVDIFYIGDIGHVTGEEKYFEYYNKEWLAGLNETLTGVANKLTKYIAPTLMNGVAIDGTVYGVPNNVPIGEYTYMMLDYDLLNAYKCTINDTDTVADEKVANFLKDMANYNKANGLSPDDEGYVVPLSSSLSECLRMLVWYWEVSYVDRTVYNTYLGVPNDSNGAPIAEAGERNYTLMQEYVTENEKDDPNNEGQTITTYKYSAYYSVVSGMLYKVNANGQYVDKNGQVLNYHYELDTTGGYVSAVEKDRNKNNDVPDVPDGEVPTNFGDIIWNARGANSWYLVDENGNTVTPENDKRVILANESLLWDENSGITGEEGAYEYKGHPVEIMTEEVEFEVDAENRTLPTYEYKWNKESDFSFVGTLMKDPSLRSRGLINLAFNNLFEDQDYISVYTTLKSYEYNGYFGTPDASKNQTAAVSFVKGDASILIESQNAAKMTVNGEEINKPAGVYVDPETGKWYRVVVAENPKATSTELYGNMFAVYARSSYLDRAMKVVNYLNTNSTMRDLLQYGVQGVHYEYETIKGVNGEADVRLVKKLTARNEMNMTDKNEQAAANGVYVMDVERTGNCFVATPTKEQGANIWTYAKVQNTNSLIDPLLGFDFNTVMVDYDETRLDVTLLYRVNKVNTEAKKYIEACTSLERLTEQFTDKTSDMQGLVRDTSVSTRPVQKWVRKLINDSYDVGEPSIGGDPDLLGESPNTVYFNWLKGNGFAVEEDDELNGSTSGKK